MASSIRVLRGGDWEDDSSGCRPACRGRVVPFAFDISFGFRAVCAPRTTLRYNKYKETKGSVCFFCGAPRSSLEFGEVEVDGNQVFRAVKCLDCMKSWRDVYCRTGVEFTEGGRDYREGDKS